MCKSNIFKDLCIFRHLPQIVEQSLRLPCWHRNWRRNERTDLRGSALNPLGRIQKVFLGIVGAARTFTKSSD